MKNIIAALILIVILIGIISYSSQGNLWIVTMTFLGATIGIPMGISYPFPIMTKLSIISGLIVSIIFIYFGLKNHKKYIGQVLALLGIVIWSFIGVIGLGTGT